MMAAIAANLDFRRKKFSNVLIYKLTRLLSWISDLNDLAYILNLQVPRYFLHSFESTGLSSQEKKTKYIFKMAAMAANLDFRRNNFSNDLIYKLFRYFLPRFQSLGHSVPGKKHKIHFQAGTSGGHLGFYIDRILVFFNLLVASILPTEFKINWRLGSGEGVKEIFKIAAILDFRCCF